VSEPIAKLDERERRLLRAALQWSRTQRYQRLPAAHSQSGGLHRTWISDDLQTCVMTLGSSLAVTRPGVPVCILAAATMTELLSMLACLKVLPARFSSLGREALDRHADDCETYARHLLVQHHDRIREPALAAWAMAWRTAADSARRFETGHAA
jgi:hypothetical protein